MNRLFLYIRFQFKLLLLLFIVIVPLAWFSIKVINLDLVSVQILLFGLLAFLRLGLSKSFPNFLQIDLKKYVQQRTKKIPSNKDMALWQEIYNEGVHAVFIIVGLFILGLKFL